MSLEVEIGLKIESFQIALELGVKIKKLLLEAQKQQDHGNMYLNL